MVNKNLLNFFMLLILSIFIIACAQQAEKTIVNENTEQINDTGILIVTSSPDNAQVYIDGQLNGNTPSTLYNFPVGKHDLIVKKEGYMDFEKSVTITAGRTEEQYASLIPAKTAAKENKSIEEEVPENISKPIATLNRINLSAFFMYYDFDKEIFTETVMPDHDVFSNKYNDYVSFTAIAPARIRILNKPITDVKIEDCASSDNLVANLYSGQTLCLKTTQGRFVALGSIWKEQPTELDWKELIKG